MKKEKGILFLSKLTGPALWGDGSLLKRYPTPVMAGVNPEHVALLGIFSGDRRYPSIVLNGCYEGMGLAELYDKEPDLFGTEQERRWGMIPISIGVGHAAADLSVQIHPTEEYALAHEGCHGKSECWYIVDVEETPSKVVLGHTARTLEEFKEMTEKEDFDHLLLSELVVKGDFFNLQAGTVHALQKGTTFIEVCTGGDITYRMYDYHRKDRNGQERKIDREKVYSNVLIPYEKMEYHYKVTQYGDVTDTLFTDNANFSVRLLEAKGKGKVLKQKPYYACFVVEGEGSINDYPLKTGDNFLLTSECNELDITGQMKILAAHG